MDAASGTRLRERDLRGIKYVRQLLPILDDLHGAACARDRAHNRKLHYDHYITLILLFFFNPLVGSLRGLQRTSQLKRIQRKLGCPRASLGSLSEAARVFDADLLRGVIGALADRLPPLCRDRVCDQARGIVTLVDSTLLHALPQITEAMWKDDNNRAFKLHTHFELLKSAPTRIDLTDARTDDRDALTWGLVPERTYVLDRGYQEYALFARIMAAGSSFVCRIRDNSAFEVVQNNDLTAEAQSLGVLRDRVVRFTGYAATKLAWPQDGIRVIEIHCKPHRRRGAKGGQPQGESLLVASDMLDVPAEVIATLYRHRWAIEIFFRFFKHVLGCRHLISHCTNGIRIQTYVAIIACLLIALWTGRRATRDTYLMVAFYFTGWADRGELLDHINELHAA
jgi:hypothetical protein